MALTIWQDAGRRCTISVSGAAIAVRLFDGEDVVDERAVSTSELALSLAEAWKTRHSLPKPIPKTRRRQATPRPTSHQSDGPTAVPRVMWIDRG